DDEGVARSDMTHEYLRAEETYKFSYTELKRFARQSLEHSFLPGESLWASTVPGFRLATACSKDAAGTEKPSAGCERFLAANERARQQWKLEGEFVKFEKKY